MANHPSAKKRHRQNLKRNERNSAVRSRMRGAITRARAAIAEKSDNQDELVKEAVREVYRAASKNIIKSNTASRQVSRLTRLRQAAE